MLILHYILVFAALLSKPEGDRKMLFSLPLDIPVSLSASFGELRPGHFHSGIDFRTNGVSGKRVLSAADGYVYRISVSPGGFGRAIYIRHNNGYSTVYGHLDRFIPEIEEYVTGIQYDRRSFPVEIYPESGRFSFSQGDLVGYSGNTGSSQGPHLHFEVRRSDNENPVDPVSFLQIEDNIKPTLNLLTIYDTGNGSGREQRRRDFSLNGSGGRYTVKHQEPIVTAGSFGIGLSAWDYIDNSWSKCGVRSIEVYADSLLVYSHTLDEFAFSESRYINTHIDFREYYENRRYIQKTFIEPNNRLSIYNTVRGNGTITFADREIHNINIRVSDYVGNISTLGFRVRSEGSSSLAEAPADTEGRMMPYGRANEFLRHDLEARFPSGTFYDTIWLSYSKVPGRSGMLADIHNLHDPAVPVHGTYTLAIRPIVTDPAKLDRAGIIMVNGDRSSFVGGSYDNGFFTARVREFGSFSIARDTLSPEVSAINLPEGGNIKGRAELKFRVKDDFSGIAGYNCYVDEKWTLLEFDPKNDLLVMPVAKSRMESGRSHQLKLVVTDNAGNISEYYRNFDW